MLQIPSAKIENVFTEKNYSIFCTGKLSYTVNVIFKGPLHNIYEF